MNRNAFLQGKCGVILIAITLLLSMAGAACADEIHDAALDGKLDQVKALVEKNPGLLNAKDKEMKAAPLHFAAKGGSKAVAAYLLEKGADVMAKAESGETPLHIAALFGSTEVAALLVARGADVKAGDKDGMTPLHWSAVTGQIPMAKFLISKGANVNAKGTDGTTALAVAEKQKQKEMAEFLKKMGAK